AEYDAARREGRQAALVTREAEASFTMAITGIEPDVPVEVDVDFVAVMRPTDVGGWELRFPLTVPPRFIREDEAGSPQAASNPLSVSIDPGHRFDMEIEVRDAWGITSPTHGISMTEDDGSNVVKLEGGSVVPDRDLRLLWRPLIGNEVLGGALYWETDGDETYFLLLAGQGKDVSKLAEPMRREVSLLIDHSGSMNGPKWETADWAAQKFLMDLRDGDFFDIAFFHNDVFLFSNEMLGANAKNIEEAVKFVTDNKSSGGTELGVALERMLLIPKIPPDERLARQLLIITDAQVSDSGRILELARREYGSADRRRISVLCVDASPNSTLTNRLAERGGGAVSYLTSSPNAEDVTTAVDSILSRWSAPVTESVTLELEANSLRIAGGIGTPAASSGVARADMGSLMGGSSLWVVGRASGLKSWGEAKTIFDGKAVSLDVRSTGGSGDAIKAIYGARQIQELEFVKGSGLSGDDLVSALDELGYKTEKAGGTVYYENNKFVAGEALDRLIVGESLKFGVVSSMTAFVASRTEKGRPAAGTVQVSNALSQGWSEDFVSGRFMLAPAMPKGLEMGYAGPKASETRSSTSEASQRLIVESLRSSSGRNPEKTSETAIYDSNAEIPGGGEVLLKKIAGSGRISGIILSGDSIKSLSGVKNSQNLVIRVYVDGGTSPSASVRLSDLVKLNGRRPLNLAYSRTVRFALANEGSDSAVLDDLSLSIF
ncbi:MAG: VWA domain-containing protein, partial [Synergistaceae bacterium]|nr:VWA domain-containing protein [Synergistaceae bacterium]